MTLGDLLPFHVAGRQAAVVGFVAALGATFVLMPVVMRKLRGAGIVGRDINKPDRPEVPEMGGIGVFLGFNVGVFAILVLSPRPPEEHVLILAALSVIAGAAMTGVVDDLVALRQRFKAFIPVVFAAPLAVYLSDYAVALPFIGDVDFGFLYPLVLVPLGITCAANGFNMLEGYNGLGAGLGIITAVGLGILSIEAGHPAALILLVPLVASLLAFAWFNRYPARIFPGDTLTLFVGAALASAAMIGKVEFWGALLFVPHVLEFVLKARGGFRAQNFAKRSTARGDRPPLLHFEGRTESLTHVVLKRGAFTEPVVVAAFWAMQAVLTAAVVVAAHQF